MPFYFAGLNGIKAGINRAKADINSIQAGLNGINAEIYIYTDIYIYMLIL